MGTKKAKNIHDGDYIMREGRPNARVIATENVQEDGGDKIVVYVGCEVLRYWLDDKVKVADA